jgi:beta-glucosidase
VNVAEYVTGLQAAGVQANMKQYFGYDSQQTDRFLYSSNMDDKTVHEIATWMYAEGARAGSASVMCSYNALNNTWASENSKALNDVLKTEIGFQGYVFTDWVFAMHSTQAANAGMDLDMPGFTPEGGTYFGANLTAAVQNETVPLWRLDDMVTRIMTPYYHLRQDQDYPTPNLNDAPTGHVANTRSYAHDAIIRRVGVESTILLKNVNNTLPLVRPRRVGVFGIDAAANPYGANQPLNIFTSVDPQQGAGTLSNGYGSGSAYYPYLIDPLNALQRRAQLDLTMIDWALNESFVPQIITKASTASVCLAFVQSIAGESLDRNLTAWHDGDNMVINVANNCRRVSSCLSTRFHSLTQS